MRAAGVALAAAALALATAGPAHASSIVFVRDGDVWLTTPDGSREHRVTRGGAYSSVTQSDAGAIFAHANGLLQRLDRDGRRLGAPVATGTMLDLDASPDGSKIAFWYAAGDGARVTVVNSDGSPSGFDDQNGWHMSWITDDLALYSNGAGHMTTMRAGLGGWSTWFSEPDGRKHDSAITRAGDRLVVVVRDYEGAGPWTVAHYANASAPPRDGGLDAPPAGARPVLRCTVAAGPIEPESPTWSPDGAAIAWEQGGAVRVQPALDLDGCRQPAGGFTIPGAASPDWGPAGVPGSARGALRSVRVARGQRLRRALRRGLRVRIRCAGHCEATARLRKGRRLVARGSRRGSGTLTLRFTRPGRRTLKRARRAKLRLEVRAGGSRRARTVVLKR